MTQVVLIAGSGETSRANIEALIDDYIYSTTDEIEFILAFERRPSQGQIFAYQLAKHRDKKVQIFAFPDAELHSVAGKVTQTNNPFGEAIAISSEAFLLWNDDDALSSSILNTCKKVAIKALDLTDGLVEIQPSKVIKDEVIPDMPEEEKTVKAETPIKIKVEEPEEELEEEAEDEEEEEYLVGDVIVEAIEEIARIFANAVLEEFNKKGKK